MTSEPHLVQLGNYQRWIPSMKQCPRCGGEVLEDHWPPNYGGGFGGGGFGKSWNSIKVVCVACRITFRISEKEEWKTLDGNCPTCGRPYEPQVTREEHYSEAVPLVEHDGLLLTPHDVWREDYKAEHGAYPKESYG